MKCNEARLLPDFVYGHSSLANLTTKFCDYAPKRRVSWGSLGRLTIEEVELRDDVFSSILAGSPKLKLFELNNCWGFQLLDTGPSSLNKLKLLLGCKGSTAFKISAPNLKSLEILGAPVSLELLNASALLEVNFRLLQGGVDTVLQLLQNRNVRHANKVFLGRYVCGVLSKTDAIDQLRLPFKHTCLVLELGVDELDHAVANLLQNSRTLETLVINMVSSYVKKEKLLSDQEKYWSSLEARRFLCLKQALKTVKINGFKIAVLPFMEFLLVNAKVLEKTSIYFDRWDYREGSELSDMAKILLMNIPRSSSKAVVEIFHQ